MQFPAVRSGTHATMMTPKQDLLVIAAAVHHRSPLSPTREEAAGGSLRPQATAPTSVGPKSGSPCQSSPCRDDATRLTTLGFAQKSSCKKVGCGHAL